MDMNDMPRGLEWMVGKLCTYVECIGDEEVVFYFELDGWKARLYHEQDCCESVYLQDVVGDLSDLAASTILLADEVSSSDAPPWDEHYVPPEPEYPGAEDSETWTYYKFATIKGYVDLRWYGSSNGYYSESVNLEWVRLHT